ncbi:hypothetical protein MASR2M78_04610 [Treponema sp.]
MATPIKRIEKDFLLKVLFDEQIPIMLRFGRSEYVVTVSEAPKREVKLVANEPVAGLRAGSKLELMFDYRSQTISFTLTVISSKDESIVAEAPEFLYKNLNRSFSRVISPDDLKVSFTFRGDRYSLSFPKIAEFEPVELPPYSDQFDPKNIKDLVNQLSNWANESASGHKLVMFKESKPTSIEERIISETGKTLFIPSTQTDLPEVDPNPRKRIITESIFKQFLEASGTDAVFIEATVERFLKSKRDADIYSDAWIPILFQEYVIGYIRIWIDTVGKPPFDLALVDTLHQFAKVLAFSLKENGYFKAGAVKKETYTGKLIDVSASGLLFSHPLSALTSSLLPDSEIDVRLSTPKRSVSCAALIVRRYKDNTNSYYGCRYINIAPEDLRFLFEHIYGKPFTDDDASFLTGKV